MKVCAVIAEFNPFHNGHKYLLGEIRKRGFTHIIAVMSGNFVQRGEPAIISKRARAEIALQNGIDLAVEIPCVWAVSTAEKFAQAGVQIADSFGCVETLAFGSECGDIKHLEKIAQTLNSEKFPLYLKNHLAEGITFAKAREKALSELIQDSQTIKQIKLPNNILGIEYLKAIDKFKAKLIPLTITRLESNSANCISATKTRELIVQGDESYKSYVPKSSFEIISREIENLKAPCALKNAEQAILYKLRTMAKNEILNLPDISEGIENRVFKAMKKALSLDELLFKIKTKRYTMSRIKRTLLSAYIGITSELQNENVPYIKVLGMTQKGSEFLKKAKQNASVPIISKYSDVSKLNLKAQKIFDAECRSTDLYSFFSPKIFPCGKEQSFKIIKTNNLNSPLT